MEITHKRNGVTLKNLSYIHFRKRMLRIFRNKHLILFGLTAILVACHPAGGHAQAGIRRSLIFNMLLSEISNWKTASRLISAK